MALAARVAGVARTGELAIILVADISTRPVVRAHIRVGRVGRAVGHVQLQRSNGKVFAWHRD